VSLPLSTAAESSLSMQFDVEKDEFVEVELSRRNDNSFAHKVKL